MLPAYSCSCCGSRMRFRGSRFNRHGSEDRYKLIVVVLVTVWGVSLGIIAANTP